MSAFCSCFKSNPQVNDNGSSRRGSTTKKGIRKENKPMDLLELNKRGMDGQIAEEDGEWIEDDQPDLDDNIRASNQTDMFEAKNEEVKVSGGVLIPIKRTIVLTAWLCLLFCPRTTTMLVNGQLTTSCGPRRQTDRGVRFSDRLSPRIACRR